MPPLVFKGPRKYVKKESNLVDIVSSVKEVVEGDTIKKIIGGQAYLFDPDTNFLFDIASARRIGRYRPERPEDPIDYEEMEREIPEYLRFR